MLKKFAAVLVILLLLSACQPLSSGKKSEGGEMSSSAESGAEESQAGAAKGEYHKITAEEAKKMMDSQTVVVVDVRTEEEYQEGHVPNALLVPNESITDQMPDALPDTSAVLLVYCRSGRRSKEASQKLVDLGYQNVYDFGGIIDWPYDTVKD